jgi:photosystem II stability/assembly factor-like uncharacterized protein
MKSVMRLVTLSLSILLIASCAEVTPNKTIVNNGKHRFDRDLLRELEEMRADKPGEAQQFFMSQRLPNGATTLDEQHYIDALQHASGLSWYSAARGQMLGARSAQQLQQLGTWQNLGPGNVGGRTRVLRFQPGHPNVIFVAGVDGGLWKSTDAGASWAPLTDLAPNLAIVSMAIDSSNPLRMWVGTGEGVFNGDARQGAGIFFSNDGGLNWNQLDSTANASFNFVNDLVQSPNAANTLYAATGAGVFRSLDSGTSWTLVVDTSAAGADLFGGCFSIKTLSGGPTDTVLASCGTFDGNSDFSALADGVIFRNTNAGGAGTWTSVLSNSNQGRATLAVAPSNPNVVYALIAAGEGTGGTYDDGLLGVWQSTNGGATWSPRVQATDGDNGNKNLLLSNPVEARLFECGFGGPTDDAFFNQGWYDNIIAVDPLDPNKVWVGGIDLWRSDDGGQNWGVASYWWFDPTDPNYAHADNHSIVFHPDFDGTTNQQMFVTSDGGLFHTNNARAAVGTNASAGTDNSICGQNTATLPAVTWNNLNNGYGVTQFYDGAVYPDNKSYFGGAQDNGTNRGTDTAGPNAWTSLLGGDGGFVAVDPTNPLNLYGEFTGISMQKSIDGGATFNDATGGISDAGLFINPFLLDNNNSNRFWTGGTKLWRSDNGMGTWAQASNLLLPAPLQFSAFATAPHLPDLLLAATDSGRMYQFTNATSLTPSTAKAATDYVLPRSLNAAYVASIQFDPTQNGSDQSQRTAIMTSSSFNTEGSTPQEPHVLKTVNGGVNWIGIDGMTSTGPSPNGLPDIPVNTVAIDPTTENTQRIFVGTDIGVFVTTDGGQTWARENTGFANTAVTKLVMQYNTTTHVWELFAFTHGRGVFKTTVSTGDYIFANGFE